MAMLCGLSLSESFVTISSVCPSRTSRWFSSAAEIKILSFFESMHISVGDPFNSYVHVTFFAIGSILYNFPTLSDVI